MPLLNLLLEQRLHVVRDLLRRHLRFETFHDVARSIDEELREVPPNVTGMGLTQLLVEIACAVPVDFDLRKEREVDVVLAAGELENLGIGAGLLGAKLITWEAEYGESAGLVVFLQSTQTCVLGRESSLTRDVHGQPNLVLECGKGDRFTRD